MKSRRLQRHLQTASDDPPLTVGHHVQPLVSAADTVSAVQAALISAAAAAAARMAPCGIPAADGMHVLQQAAEQNHLDCQTPHHTKLPAPGANMRHELQPHGLRTQTGHTDQCNTRQQANSDPIVSTVSHRRATWRDEAAPRQKGGLKAFATLSFQRAPSAAPQTAVNKAVQQTGGAERPFPENQQPDAEQRTVHDRSLAHKLQKPFRRHSASEAARQRLARQASEDGASHSVVCEAEAPSKPQSFRAADLDKHQAAGHDTQEPVGAAHSSQQAIHALSSNARAPSRLKHPAPACINSMQNTSSHPQHRTVCNAVQDGSETQPDLQASHADNTAQSCCHDNRMMHSSPIGLEAGVKAEDSPGGSANGCSNASSPIQLSSNSHLQSGSQAHRSLQDATADCCLDMPGPVHAVIAMDRLVPCTTLAIHQQIDDCQLVFALDSCTIGLCNVTPVPPCSC